MSTAVERANEARWWFAVTGTPPHRLASNSETLEVLELRARAMLDVAITVLAERHRHRRQRQRSHAVHRSPLYRSQRWTRAPAAVEE
jgi:hypothetical protein